MTPNQDRNEDEHPKIRSVPSRRLFDGPMLSTSVPRRKSLDLETYTSIVREEAANLASMESNKPFDNAFPRSPDQTSASVPPQEPTIVETPPLHTEDAPPPSPQNNSNSSVDMKIIADITKSLPAVLVGTLLNILDGLSYGMIFFPPIAVFADLEATGLSLFYISTVICQLVFSLGGSGFKACVGSQMIEVVPFFHSIGLYINSRLPGASRDEVVATTIVAFAFSTIITGLTFFLLGFLRLGTLVGFFPMHILLGAIGGVGLFLVMTGFDIITNEVKSITEILSQPEIVGNIAITVCICVPLMVVERKVKSALSVPLLLVSAFLLFHLVIYLTPNFDLNHARAWGWVFPAQESGEPWYAVYKYYNPSLIHIKPVIECIPTMLALTFFGIIHVPINIPALSSATGESNVDVNKELVGHGISNTLAGLFGSVQNYLVYTNSVMFIRSGADSRLSGILLCVATVVVMISGPSIIGYIPVSVVAALILMMGFDLIAEALVNTFGKVRKQEYATMAVITFVMALYDFVVGIGVGIALACLFFVISSAKTDPVTSHFTGVVAHSTVLRPPVLNNYLRKVGNQIHILRLSGALFFGTNGKLESGIKTLFGGNQSQHVKYLILDLQHVTNIDYCTADTFLRLKCFLDEHQVCMVLTGAETAGHKIRGLKAVDLVPEENLYEDDSLQVRVFATLNIGLEWCENQFIKQYYYQKGKFRTSINDSLLMTTPTPSLSLPMKLPELKDNEQQQLLQTPMLSLGTTPRASNMQMAARSAVKSELQTTQKWSRHEQPLPLLMQIVQPTSSKPVDFWINFAPYLKEVRFVAGSALARGLYLVEDGVIVEKFSSGYQETALPGTVVGSCETNQYSEIVVEQDAKVWLLTPNIWQHMKTSNNSKILELVIEFAAVQFDLLNARFARTTEYFRIAD